MPTLSEALHTYLQIERRPATQRYYSHILGRLVTAIGPARQVERVTYEDLLDHQASFRADLSPSSVFSYTGIIRTFFAWCVHRRYIEFSPAEDLVARSPRAELRHDRAIPAEDLRRMVEYARVTSPRNHALLLFLIDTACRVGGLCSLTLDHLDLPSYSAVLQEKGAKIVRVSFYTETAAALAKWLDARPAATHAYVFTGQGPDYPPLQVKAVQSIIKRLALKTGSSKPWGPHSIRHAVGHAYAALGVPPTVTRDKLNHSNVMTTMNFYYPQDKEYIEMISHRYALAPLHTDDPRTQPPPPIPLSGSG